MNPPDAPPPPPRRWGIQAKLTIGQPNDVYEQEADRVAEQVMSMSSAATPTVQRQAEEEETEEIQTKPLAETITPLVQRQADLEEDEPIQAKCENCEAEEPIQRFADGTAQAQPDLENRLNASQGGGSALPDDVRSFMEPRFGADFSQVRVHTGSEAVQMNRDLNAQAFTHKQDVYFGAGKTPGNNTLTAHELTHVVQQTSNPSDSLSKVRQNIQCFVSDNSVAKDQDQSTENELDPTQQSVPSGRDIIDPRIDVRAQFALLRLFKAPPPDSTDAINLFRDVKSEGIRGIFGDDLQAAVKLAHARGRQRWELVPPDRDSIKLDDGLPDTPTIIFKEISGKKPRLDAALLSAYREEGDKDLEIPSKTAASDEVKITKELQKQKHIANQDRVYGIIENGLKIADPNSNSEAMLKNSCEWIDQGKTDFTVLTPTHDTFARARGFLAYFDPLIKYPQEGGDYPFAPPRKSPHITFGGFGTVGDTSKEKNLIRLFDPESQTDPELMKTIVHEVQHNADQADTDQPWVVDGGQDLNEYESEFRARWIGNFQTPNNDFGSPTNPAKNEKVLIDKSGKLNVQTTGFHSERQENVFWNIVDNGYEFVRREYLRSPEFRKKVDDYSLPIGGNLMNSVRIQNVSKALSHSNQQMARLSAEVNFVFEAAGRLNKVDSRYLKDESFSKPFWDQARSSLSPQIFEELRGDIISG